MIKIDWTHPIAKKLGFLWVGPHTGGPFGRDLVSGVTGVVEGAGDPLTRDVGARGHALSQINDGAAVQGLRFQGVSITNSGGMSCFLLHRHTDASQAFNTPLTCFNDSGSRGDANLVFNFEPIVTIANQISVYLGTEGSDVWATVGADAGDGIWHSYGMRKPWNSTAGDVFVDGVGPTDNFSGVSVSQETIGDISLATTPDYPEEGMGGDLVFAAVFKEQLSDAEFVALHKNPWQMLIDTTNPIIGAHLIEEDVRFATVKMPWTKAPPPGTEIDMSHPLARQLRIFLRPNVAHQSVMDEMGIAETSFGSAHSIQQDSKYGDVMYNDGLGTSIQMTLADLNEVSKSDVTYAALMKFDTHDTGGRVMVTSGGGGDDSFQMEHLANENYNAEIGVGATNDGTQLGVASRSWTDWYLYGVSRSNGEGQWAFINEVRSALDTGQTGTPNDLLHNIVIFPGGTFAGHFACFATWDRILTASEAKSFYENPWQIFKPQELHVPFNEALPDLAKFEIEQTSMPARPPK